MGSAQRESREAAGGHNYTGYRPTGSLAGEDGPEKASCAPGCSSGDFRNSRRLEGEKVELEFQSQRQSFGAIQDSAGGQVLGGAESSGSCAKIMKK